MPLSRDPHTSSNESATNHNTTEPPDTPNDNEHVHPPVGVVIAGAIIFGIFLFGLAFLAFANTRRAAGVLSRRHRGSRQALIAAPSGDIAILSNSVRGHYTSDTVGGIPLTTIVVGRVPDSGVAHR